MGKVMKMSKFKYRWFFLLFFFPAISLYAAVPEIMNYQGTVKDSTGAPLNGIGYFKFAIVDQPGTTATTAYWANSGTPGLTEPPDAVPVAVTNGVFSVKLGDNVNLANMVTLPQSVFDSDSLYLRVWFSVENTVGTFEQFATDIQIDMILKALQVSQGI